MGEEKRDGSLQGAVLQYSTVRADSFSSSTLCSAPAHLAPGSPWSRLWFFTLYPLPFHWECLELPPTNCCSPEVQMAVRSSSKALETALSWEN